jgi:exonuclease III
MVQETHGTPGTIDAARTSLADWSTWWSHGNRHQGGIGILLTTTFLANFKTPTHDDWYDLEGGRLAALHLQGHHGDLGIMTAYFATGPLTDDTFQARSRTRQRMQQHLQQHPHRRWIVAGDFNWVPSPTDRVELKGGTATGESDTRDEAHWKSIVQQPHTLLELSQPHFTYYGTTARSRLDRAYTNHHPADWFPRYPSAAK